MGAQKDDSRYLTYLTAGQYQRMAPAPGSRHKAPQSTQYRQSKSIESSRGQSSPLPKISESDIRAQIKDYLMLHGWLTWINWQGPFSFRGVTDLTAIRGGQVWWIEIKRPGERLRPDQETFRDLIAQQGGNWLMATCIEDVEFLCRLDRG